MIELPLVFVGGALGSASHCIGMCGPFALALGSAADTSWGNLRRQVVYSLGRVFTYAVLGACAGYAGARLAGISPGLVRIPSMLAIVAGCLLIYQGLRSAGLFQRTGVASAKSGCLASTFFGSFLAAPGLRNAFLAGLFTGLLPCGLLYGILALAASTASIWWAMAVMIAFGLGTAPVMILIGAGASAVSLAARRHMLHVAAWCLVVTGVVSVARGAGFMAAAATENSLDGCPACSDTDSKPTIGPTGKICQ